MKAYKYIEIKTFDSGEVIKRLDITGKNDSLADKIESGMNINLNHDKYYTFSFDSEKKQKVI